MPIQITSTAFAEGGTIPSLHTCDGRDVSPPLSWTGIPPAARSLALVCDDPDAPGKTWVHWVVYALPPGTAGLPEAVPAREELPDGGRQGTNDFRKIGYGGPCPPSGTHRYFFKLYALDTEVTLPPGATKAQLEQAIEGSVLEQATLMGRYART